MIDRYLSIWEVAHRWHDANPDKTDPADLPLIVQDALRYICRGVLSGSLGLFHIIVMGIDNKYNGSGFRSDIAEIYVDECPAELENCLYRQYDKKVLNSFFIDCIGFFEYCMHSQLSEINSFVDFPPFWSSLIDTSSPSVDAADTSTPSSAQPIRIDKRLRTQIACQQIAQSIWLNKPDSTNLEIALSQEIQQLGGGSEYQLDTVQEWLSEIDPRDPSKKRGRKRKNNSGSSNPTSSQPTE